MIKSMIMVAVLTATSVTGQPVTYVKNATTTEQAAKVKADTGVKVIMFSAEWCHYCTQMYPILDRLSIKYKGKVSFYKLDVDKIGIQTEGVPVTIVTKNDKNTIVLDGAVSEAELDAAIQTYLKGL